TVARRADRATTDGGAFDDRACRDHPDPHLRTRRRLTFVLRRRDRTVHDDFEGGAMFSRLATLGWDPAWDAVRATFDLPDCEAARVATQHRGGYLLLTEHGESAAVVSGRFRHDSTASADFPV